MEQRNEKKLTKIRTKRSCRIVLEQRRRNITVSFKINIRNKKRNFSREEATVERGEILFNSKNCYFFLWFCLRYIDYRSHLSVFSPSFIWPPTCVQWYIVYCFKIQILLFSLDSQKKSIYYILNWKVGVK